MCSIFLRRTPLTQTSSFGYPFLQSAKLNEYADTSSAFYLEKKPNSLSSLLPTPAAIGSALLHIVLIVVVVGFVICFVGVLSCMGCIMCGHRSKSHHHTHGTAYVAAPQVCCCQGCTSCTPLLRPLERGKGSRTPGRALVVGQRIRAGGGGGRGTLSECMHVECGVCERGTRPRPRAHPAAPPTVILLSVHLASWCTVASFFWGGLRGVLLAECCWRSAAGGVCACGLCRARVRGLLAPFMATGWDTIV